MKLSKNLGITKSCPECRKTLIKAVNFQGEGSFKTKCPHCKSLIMVEVKPKTMVTLSKIVILIVIIVFSFSIGVYFQSEHEQLAEISDK